MIQLMITYYIIFASVNVSKIFVAVCAFGINSGAYVAEIVRSGIMSIDQGQFEAGRSLGFNLSLIHICASCQPLNCEPSFDTLILIGKRPGKIL